MHTSEPQHDKTTKMTCEPSEISDQPGHPPILIRIFTMRSNGSYGPNLSSCGQRRLWSNWADAQTDLSLRWAHIPYCWFCHDVAHLICFSGDSIISTMKIEPRNDKTNKVTVLPAQTQIRLPGHPPSLIRVLAVRMKKAWVVSSPLSAQRRSDQTAWMPRLIWVFAGRTVTLLVCRVAAHIKHCLDPFSVMFVSDTELFRTLATFK